MSDKETSSGGGEISPEVLKKAYKAFKKRLKLEKLADSGLGGGALSGGDRGLTAVRPPDQYPKEVWEELVRQGKIRSAGYGMYELAEH
ncbi:MAG: hypothetical protein AMJ79_09015 [Phycisphaerae bacterium SM23_30]|nr:MAG: hypothetical protein AMJ79_09015 [Phycisphaerae bacterium SM23_30]